MTVIVGNTDANKSFFGQHLHLLFFLNVGQECFIYASFTLFKKVSLFFLPSYSFLQHHYLRYGGQVAGCPGGEEPETL